MPRLAMVAALLTLMNLAAGCTALERARKAIGPDGSEHLLISCFSPDWCYSEASSACGGSYRLVNTSAETSSLFSGQVETTTTLLIKCG